MMSSTIAAGVIVSSSLRASSSVARRHDLEAGHRQILFVDEDGLAIVFDARAPALGRVERARLEHATISRTSG